MKITQSQYFEIEEFFTERCRLVEDGFIKEMTDHFMDGIEAKMSDEISFNNALDQTIEEFGGIKALRKMQFGFQKALVKKQLRERWILTKGFFVKPKLYKTIAISVAVTAITFYVCLFTSHKSMDHKDFFLGFLSSMLIFPIGATLTYLIQYQLGWLRSFGLIKAQNIADAGIPLILNLVSVFVFILISEFTTVLIVKALLLSVLWSALALSYFILLVYSKKIDADNWYQTR